MEKLRVKIYRYKTLVFGEIVHCSESLRNTNEHKCEMLASNDEYSIFSELTPAIRPDSLYVFGNNAKDDYRIMRYEFSSEESACLWCRNIRELIDKINRSSGSDASNKSEIIVEIE